MTTTGLDVFDTTIQKTNIWLKDLMEELGTPDKHRAYLALRSTLQALRDRLPVEEAAQLGDQLPMLIRGFYYDAWVPAGKPERIRHKEEFLARISDAFRNDPDIDPEQVVKAVFRVLTRRISEGEIQDITGLLPHELRELWPVQAGR